MRRPDSAKMSAKQARRIIDFLGAPDVVAESLCVAVTEVEQWREHGVPPGPVAACLRYFARSNRIDGLYSPGDCVLCGSDALKEVAGTPICRECSSDPSRAAENVGFDYRQDERYLLVHAPASFEMPLHAAFAPQAGRANDPEVDDEEFDRAVQIESRDYEMLFDMFQVPRRRNLVFELTRNGRVSVDVNDVSFFPDGRWSTEQAVHLVLLAWSLTHERSPFV